MGKLLAVIKREYLERVRTRWFIITTVFGPLLFGALMILPAWMSVRSLRDARVSGVTVVDATGAGLGARVQARLVAPGGDAARVPVRAVAPSEIAATESTLTLAVMRKEIDGYLVLDSLTLAGTSARYAGRNASAVGESEAVETAVRQSVLAHRLEAQGLDPQRIDELTRVRVRLQTERITDKGRGGSGLGATILGFGVAFLLYMSLVLYGQNTLRSVLEEKTTRVAEVIVASVKPDTLLAGKVLGVAAVGLTQQVAWIASAVVLWKVRAPLFAKLGMGAMPALPLPQVSAGLLVAFLLFFVLGFVFYSSLFAAAGAMVNSDQEAGQASQPILMLLVASIIFLQPILLNPSGTLSKVMSWLPFSAPIVMPLRMSVIPIDPLELAAVLGGMVVACGAAVWVSARIYRVGLLMYGKRPTLRELGRWVTEA
jgi:ABC-2 type transport system permease protein